MGSIRFLSFFFFFLFARDHRPNSSPAADPTIRVYQQSGTAFFHMLIPSLGLSEGQSSTPLASIPNAILAFPQEARTALRDYVERNPHAQGTTPFFFFSPL